MPKPLAAGRPGLPNSGVRTAPSHLVDFSSARLDSVFSYQHRVRFGDISLTRGSLLPNPAIYIGAEQVIVVRHCGPAQKLDWRPPDSDRLRSQLIQRGTLHIKRERQQFWQSWARPADVLVVALDAGFFAKVSSEALGSEIDLKSEMAVSDHKLTELMGLFDRELIDGCANGRAYIEHLAAALTIDLSLRGADRTPVPLRQASLAPAQLRRILDYIDLHLADDLGLTELSNVAGLNPYHLAHAFKTATGLPPHRFILSKRIDKARELLSDKRLSVAEVAFTCGFSSQSHFTQHFRRNVGTTPAKYRREL